MYIKANYLIEFPKIFWTMVFVFLLTSLGGLLVGMFYSYTVSGIVCSLVVLSLYLYSKNMQKKIVKELTIGDSGLKITDTKIRHYFKYAIERYDFPWSGIDDVVLLDKKKGPMNIKTKEGDILFQIISKPEINKEIVNEIRKRLAVGNR